MRNKYITHIPKSFWLVENNFNAIAWIRAQANAYKYVAEVIEKDLDKPVPIDILEVKYSTPYKGWIETKICINGAENSSFYLNAYDNPVIGIIKWLEGLIECKGMDRLGKIPESAFINSSEHESIVFHVQTMSCSGTELCIFIVYNCWPDDNGNKIAESSSGVAIVQMRDLIAAFYRPLMKVFENLPEHDEDSKSNSWYCFERQERGIIEFLYNKSEFMPLIKSNKIETYLKKHKL